MSDLYKHYYSVSDEYGFPKTVFELLTRNQFIRKTGVDPVSHKCIYT